MTTAKLGDTVKVAFTAMSRALLESREGGMIEFRIGEGEVIRGLERMVIGMKPNEKKRKVVPAREAFGERNPRLIKDFIRDKIPPEIDAREGGVVRLHLSDGRDLPVVIQKVAGNTVTVDANHPLAGEDLVFDVELMEITDVADVPDPGWLERFEE